MEIEVRPWGQYEVLLDEKAYKVKRITVNPGQKLSYQSHQKRDEHWTIVSGRGIVVLNDIKSTIEPGQYIYIPRGRKHRVCSNPNETLVFIEVQTGDYFGEDDIVRYEDDYGRTSQT